MGGGAGGHMWHPFDCPEVTTGAELLAVFEKSGKWLQRNPGSLKVDGVNLSCRLNKNPDFSTGYEFVVDRGSTSGAGGELDMKGVTAKNAHLRFINKRDPSAPHGMVANTATLLKIMNSALPDIMSELKQLGLTEQHGPTGRYFNMEYVDVTTGAANVKKYPFNFIAFHGVRKFILKPGGKARIFKDVTVDQDTINKMVEKIRPHAEGSNFKVFSKIETKLSEPVNLEGALKTKFSIVLGKMSDDPGALIEQSTKSLGEWLSEVDNIPKDDVVTLSEEAAQRIKIPQAQNAFAKKIYAAVYNGAAISDLVDKTQDRSTWKGNVKAIADAAVIWEATRVVGNAFLKASESELGPLVRGKDDQEEGVVVAPTDWCSGVPFKYSGDFILDNLKSGFGMSEKLLREQQEDSNIKKVIAIYPGRFQPAGRHHAAAYNWLKTTFGAEETYVATSGKVEAPKSPFTFEEKQSILGAHGIPAEKIVKTNNPYKAEEITAQFDPETTAVVFMVGEKDMKEDPRFKNVGGNLKSGKPAYFKSFDDHQGRLAPLNKHGYIVVAKHVALPVPGHGEMSGTALRAFLGTADQDQFKSIMGFYDEEIYKMIQARLKEANQEGLQENFLALNSLFSLVDDVLLEEKVSLTINSLFSLIDEVLLEKKMSSGDKNRETRLKKKMDPHKEKFVNQYVEKGKTREEAESIYFATIRKRSMAEEKINEIAGEQQTRAAIGNFLKKLFLANPELRKLDINDLTSISEPIADEIIKKIDDASKAQPSVVQKADAIERSVAEASGAGGGIAGFAGPFGKKEQKNEKKRSHRRN